MVERSVSHDGLGEVLPFQVAPRTLKRAVYFARGSSLETAKSRTEDGAARLAQAFVGSVKHCHGATLAIVAPEQDLECF
jgi:hypothetical protein